MTSTDEPKRKRMSMYLKEKLFRSSISKRGSIGAHWKIKKENYYFSFENILEIPECRQVFSRFLSETRNHEISLFMDVLRDYRSITDKEKRIQEAKDIYQKFFCTTGKYEINICSEQRQLIEKRIQQEDISSDMFDSAETQIKLLLKQELFKRFLKSFVFQDFCLKCDQVTFQKIASTTTVPKDDRVGEEVHRVVSEGKYPSPQKLVFPQDNPQKRRNTWNVFSQSPKEEVKKDFETRTRATWNL